jgi:hypothetical protein
MNFRNLIKFPRIYIGKKGIQKRKIYKQFWADSGPSSWHRPSPAAKANRVRPYLQRGKVFGSVSHPNGVVTVRRQRQIGAAVFLDNGGFQWAATVGGGSYSSGGRRRGLGVVQPRKAREELTKGGSWWRRFTRF